MLTVDCNCESFSAGVQNRLSLSAHIFYPLLTKTVAHFSCSHLKLI